MRGEHYSKRPRPEENSGTYANSTPPQAGSAVRLLADERCHNHPDRYVEGDVRHKELDHRFGHCVEDVRKGYA